MTGSPALSSEMVKTHRVSHTRMISYNRTLSNESVISDIDEEEDEDLIINDLSLKNDVNPTKYYDFLAEIDRQVFHLQSHIESVYEIVYQECGVILRYRHGAGVGEGGVRNEWQRELHFCGCYFKLIRFNNVLAEKSIRCFTQNTISAYAYNHNPSCNQPHRGEN